VLQAEAPSPRFYAEPRAWLQKQFRHPGKGISSDDLSYGNWNSVGLCRFMYSDT